MWHKNHIIRSVLAPCLALSALLGGGTAPAAAGEGGSATPGPDFKPGPRPGEGDGYGLGIGPGPGDGWGSGQGDGHVRATTGDPRDAGATIFTGEAFDTCLAPSAATMRAWQGASPFGAAGVYIGGRARACPNQPNLDSDWVKKVDAMGWKLIPIFVGSQSPCVRSDRKRGYLMSHNGSGDQGAEEGRTAVQDAKALGMTAHSAIYLDMEAYDNTRTRCAATTLKFIQGWNRAVRAEGYLPGFYSSADSGIEHMEGARKAGREDLPGALWFARWRVPPSVEGEKVLDKGAWQPHRRIHQYDGNVWRTYGGHRVHIDRNVMDAPVAVIGDPGAGGGGLPPEPRP